MKIGEEDLVDIDWRQLYDKNWPWVYRLVCRLGCGQIDPEDATQDVFLAIIRKLPEFEGRSTLNTWIYRICVNTASEHRRRAWRRRRLSSAVTLLSPRRSKAAAEENIAARDALGKVQQLLAKLDEPKRQVFVLREIEQLSGAEVADILDIPRATVRTRLHHARKEFCALLERHGVTP
jgi:RNA polymerase sigma-70 factor (ECF subfamily)